jgi:hypothetical protein
MPELVAAAVTSTAISLREPEEETLGKERKVKCMLTESWSVKIKKQQRGGDEAS